MSNGEEKCHRFLSGLNHVIKQPLISCIIIDDYLILVERSRRIEIFRKERIQKNLKVYKFLKLNNSQSQKLQLLRKPNLMVFEVKVILENMKNAKSFIRVSVHQDSTLVSDVIN